MNNRLKERKITRNPEGIKYAEKIKISGVMDDYVSFVLEHQLKDRVVWHKICEVFSTREDIDDEGCAENISENSCAERCMRIAIPGMKSCTIF